MALELTRIEEKGLTRTIMTKRTGAARLQKERELFDEYSLGIISPNRSRTKVSRTVITTNSSQTELPKSTICPIARSSRSIIATFTRLLVISIDASSLSESDVRATILLSRGSSEFLTLLISSGESEKKEVSDAETNPERNRKSKAVTIAMTDPTVGELNDSPRRAAVPTIPDTLYIKGAITLQN